MLKKCGIEPVSVKTSENLKGLKGLIIPGGESTTIGKLLKRFGLFDEIIEKAREGMAIWGTCAGAILLAKNVVGEEGKIAVESLELMDVCVERNAYGRQVDSFETEIEFDFFGKNSGAKTRKIPAVFIRAPKIVSVGSGAKVLARDGAEIVAVLQGKFLATTFHPEMTDDLSVHQFFAGICGGI